MAHRRSRTAHVDVLWEEAKSHARKLTAKERRRVIVYLKEIGETKLSNVELAKVFQVDEKVIAADKRRILSDLATSLTPEAQMLIVARHMDDLEELIATGRRGLHANDSGTLNERFYLETLMKLYKERRETYENVGIIRKELGTLNVAEEHWVAEADISTGALSVRQADESDLSNSPS